jgi:RNA 2',3'-cyclic 3'-phosphodiesterase
MRLFIGCPLQEKTKYTLNTMQSYITESAYTYHLVDPNLFHITLCFIGELSGEHIDLICDALEDALYQIEPLELMIGDIGSFIRGTEHLVFVSVIKGEKKLAQLASLVRKSLQTIKMPFDQKKFKPHITLARRVQFKDESMVHYVDNNFEPFLVDEVILYKSHREKGKLMYTPLYTVKLTV